MLDNGLTALLISDVDGEAEKSSSSSSAPHPINQANSHNNKLHGHAPSKVCQLIIPAANSSGQYESCLSSTAHYQEMMIVCCCVCRAESQRRRITQVVRRRRVDLMVVTQTVIVISVRWRLM